MTITKSYLTLCAVYKTFNTTKYVGFFIMPRIRAVLSTFTLTRQSKQKKLNRSRTSLRAFFLNPSIYRTGLLMAVVGVETRVERQIIVWTSFSIY